MILWSEAGSGVPPIPSDYAFTLRASVISETVATSTGGGPGKWTFGAASSPVKLVDGVSTAKVGEPPVSVPFFRYFAYEGGQVATAPLPTPLSTENAAKVVQVDIAFTVPPRAGAIADPSALVTLTDSATLRIEPASEDSAVVNLPCV